MATNKKAASAARGISVNQQGDVWGITLDGRFLPSAGLQNALRTAWGFLTLGTTGDLSLVTTADDLHRSLNKTLHKHLQQMFADKGVRSLRFDIGGRTVVMSLGREWSEGGVGMTTGAKDRNIKSEVVSLGESKADHKPWMTLSGGAPAWETEQDRLLAEFDRTVGWLADIVNDRATPLASNPVDLKPVAAEFEDISRFLP